MKLKSWILVATIVAGVIGTVGPVKGEEAETVYIRGETHSVWPVEDLIARGLDAQVVPSDKNAAWVYIRAINAYKELPAPAVEAFEYAHTTAWPTDQQPLIDYLLDGDNRQAIELMMRAAGMDRCQMPYFGDPSGSVISILLPNLSHMRFLAKMVAVEGRRLESTGKHEAAIDHYLALMGMGEHAAQGFTLIEGLVGVATWQTGRRFLISLVLRHDLSVKQLTRIEKELNRRIKRLPTTEKGLLGERSFGPTMVDEACTRPLFFLRYSRKLLGRADDVWFNPGGSSAIPKDGWGRLEQRVGRLMLPDRTIKEHMRGFYDQVVLRAQVGAYQADALQFDEDRYIQEKIPKWDVMSREWLPSLSRATLLGERAKADMALTRAVVGIRLHSAKEDGPPSDLSGVVKRLPDGSLIDPFSGHLLSYRRTLDGWLVYSNGPNLIDDDGVEGKTWETGDIVYRYPPSPITPFKAEATNEED